MKNAEGASRAIPIPTRWSGITYRSRTEARWAVFFDGIGLRYEYEPEGFSLSNGVCYLPDFYLPQVRFWAEVKPEYVTDAEDHKARRLVAETGRPCIYLVGSPAFQAYHGCTLDCGEVTTTTYSLDIHMHWRAFQQRRLYSDPPYLIPSDPRQFSQQYIDAVASARNERFGVGEAA